MDEENRDIPSVENEDMSLEVDFRDKMFQDIDPEPDMEENPPVSPANILPTPQMTDVPTPAPQVAPPMQIPQTSTRTPPPISARPQRTRQMPKHLKDFALF